MIDAIGFESPLHERFDGCDHAADLAWRTAVGRKLIQVLLDRFGRYVSECCRSRRFDCKCDLTTGLIDVLLRVSCRAKLGDKLVAVLSDRSRPLLDCALDPRIDEAAGSFSDFTLPVIQNRLCSLLVASFGRPYDAAASVIDVCTEPLAGLAAGVVALKEGAHLSSLIKRRVAAQP